MIPYGEGEQAYLVVDQTGVIHFLDEKGGKPGKAFLDLRKSIVNLKKGFDERGSLGVALHPQFKSTRKVYVYYSAPLASGGTENFDHTAHLSEFKVKADGTADTRSERIIFTVDQPQWNHDGGNLVFGKDGFLYLGLGDGGAANDLDQKGKPEGGHEKGGNGQVFNRYLGKFCFDIDSKTFIILRQPLHVQLGRERRSRSKFAIRGASSTARAILSSQMLVKIALRKSTSFCWQLRLALPRVMLLRSAETREPCVRYQPRRGFVAPVLVYPHHDGLGKAAGYGVSVIRRLQR